MSGSQVSYRRPRLPSSYTLSVVLRILFNYFIVWGQCSKSREVTSLWNLGTRDVQIFLSASQESATHLWFTSQ